jgi:hypothetical protein
MTDLRTTLQLADLQLPPISQAPRRFVSSAHPFRATGTVWRDGDWRAFDVTFDAYSRRDARRDVVACLKVRPELVRFAKVERVG